MYNDGVFSDDDWSSLCNIRDSVKVDKYESAGMAHFPLNSYFFALPYVLSLSLFSFLQFFLNLYFFLRNLTLFFKLLDFHENSFIFQVNLVLVSTPCLIILICLPS